MANGPTFFVGYYLTPEKPSTLILYGPFIKDGMEFLQKKPKPKVVQGITFLFPVVLLMCQVGFGEHLDFFLVILLLGLSLIGVNGMKVAKEERSKFLSKPLQFDSHVLTAIQAATELGLGLFLTNFNWPLIQECSQGRFVTGTIFLVLGGIATVSANAILPNQTLRRYSVLENIGAHVFESLSNGFKFWSDYLQVITGVVQFGLGLLYVITDYQDIKDENAKRDPSAEQLCPSGNLPEWRNAFAAVASGAASV
jgi:hypothetical protein